MARAEIGLESPPRGGEKEEVLYSLLIIETLLDHERRVESLERKVNLIIKFISALGGTIPQPISPQDSRG